MNQIKNQAKRKGSGAERPPALFFFQIPFIDETAGIIRISRRPRVEIRCARTYQRTFTREKTYEFDDCEIPVREIVGMKRSKLCIL